jgi:phenylacetate-CoA ligase
VDILRRWRPAVLVAYTQAAVDLAKFIVERGLRDWDDLPVLCCAERLFPVDRAVLKRAFGDGIFETYGCREVMLIGSECHAHDGLHLSAENLVVEVVVRSATGERPALPGEVGEVVITDLHNLGMPFIRYVNGDLAVQGPALACACGRTLPRLGSVEGRSTETLRDAAGRRVGGLVFNLIMVPLADRVRQFQVVQHVDGSITLKLDAATLSTLTAHVERYLPGMVVRTEVVRDIPTTAAGKHAVVVVEK